MKHIIGFQLKLFTPRLFREHEKLKSYLSARAIVNVEHLIFLFTVMLCAMMTADNHFPRTSSPSRRNIERSCVWRGSGKISEKKFKTRQDENCGKMRWEESRRKREIKLFQCNMFIKKVFISRKNGDRGVFKDSIKWIKKSKERRREVAAKRNYDLITLKKFLQLPTHGECEILRS